MLIVNPAAGRGTSAEKLKHVLASFAGVGITNSVMTRAPGDEERCVREAQANGFDTIVACGGDGTCSKVTEAILSGDARCRLGVVPMGTGNDFAKSLGVFSLSASAIAALCVSGRSVQFDAGKVDERWFINTCGFGFDAAVLEKANGIRWLKGNPVYIYAALKELFSYGGMRVDIGDERPSPERTLMVVAANGQYLGGAFRIAPAASLTDGMLDVVTFTDAGVFARAGLFAAALRGAHAGRRGVTITPADDITLSFDAPPAMEVDGELRTASSRVVRLRCVRGALDVIAAAPRERLLISSEG